MDPRERIEQALAAYGITPEPEEWDTGEDGLRAKLGEWQALVDDEARGLYEGDTGVLTACVVGAPEHGNERVCIAFTPEGQDPDTGPEVVPFDDVEPVP